MKIFFSIALVVFTLSASAQHTKLLEFNGSNGSQPWGSLISDGTFLYGLTGEGGTNDDGVIFKILPDGSGYAKLFDFNGSATGSFAPGSLCFDGTFLYGMTTAGGVNDFGTIFKIRTDGTGFLKMLDFAGSTNGARPEGSLLWDGTFLYGMTALGGANNIGTIFKILPDGSGYTKLLDFNGSANGARPYGSLISDGTFLYGMTYDGGTNDNGVIFKILKDGTGYSKLLNFAGASNGRDPMGSLLLDGEFLFGMTLHGGAVNDGTIFKIKTDGTGFVKLFDCDINNLHIDSPYGDLITDGESLFGLTYVGGEGGTHDYGTLFKIEKDGTGFNILHHFTTVSGGWLPYGSPLLIGSTLFGMTQQGGAASEGTIFSYQLTASTNQPPVISSTSAAVPIEGIVTIDLESLISDPDDNLDPASLYLANNVSEQGASANIEDGSFLLTLNYGGVRFLGTDHVTIGICDLLNECSEQELTIEVSGDMIVFNAVSLNGDTKNEILRIQSIDMIPDAANNRVTIFNRWGDMVFEVKNYDNADRVFKGIGKNGSELPSGTYYYKIEFTGGRKTQTGYLSLKR